MEGKTVIDMGTGTGILAILAKKRGAGETYGIDIDEFAVDNARENAGLNQVEIFFETGDDSSLTDLPQADLFFANINLNVILDNLAKYVGNLKKGGKIFLSGFLDTDREKILEAAKELNLRLIKECSENHWVTMVFSKQNAG